MKAKLLFKDLLGPDFRVHPLNENPPAIDALEITSVTDDSSKVTKGGIFFAVRGTKFDAHDHLSEVIRREPAALCVEDVSRVPSEFEGVVFEAENVRLIYAKACYQFAQSPADNWLNVAVTGTNGKTTVAHMIEHILRSLGTPIGVIGTIDHHLGEHRWPTRLTTPGPFELAMRLKEFSDRGAKALVMEVSSHALSQFRADGIPFNIGIFTNLTRDHLDFHCDMNEYFEAKARLFTDLIPSQRSPRGAVINMDDEFGQQLARRLKMPLIRFGRSHAELTYQILEENFAGTLAQIEIEGEKEILRLNVPCRHNLQNALAALGAGILMGLKKKELLKCLEGYHGVKGRLESVRNSKNIFAFVDYAHTDDALKSVLSSLDTIRKGLQQKSKIITVFGCGGDRDRGKRPMMYEAALKFSDKIIVTSDNPRTEDPHQILDEVLKNAKSEDMGSRVFREVDRRKAIALAVEKAGPGDVILVAGKGHEDYQIQATQRIPFSDSEVLSEILEGAKK